MISLQDSNALGLMVYYGPIIYWLLFSGFSVCYCLRFVRKKKALPFLLRMGFLGIGALGGYVFVENYIFLTLRYAEYLPLIKTLSIPILIVTVVCILIGGYQYVNRPGCDPKKKTAYYKLLAMVIFSAVALEWLCNR